MSVCLWLYVYCVCAVFAEARRGRYFFLVPKLQVVVSHSVRALEPILGPLQEEPVLWAGSEPSLQFQSESLENVLNKEILNVKCLKWLSCDLTWPSDIPFTKVPFVL